MRAWLIGLSLPLVVACAGKSVGSDGKEPTQASVEESLPSWCQSTCEKLSTCDVGRNNSVGSVADCAQSCRAELTDGVQRSQACAQRIQQFKGCVDAGGCAVLSGDVCSLDDAEECDDDNDDDSQSPGAAPTASGSGGSYPGPGPAPSAMVGTAGAPSSGSVPPVVYCSSGSGAGVAGGAGGAGPSPAGAQVICETSYVDCSNRSSYYAICVSTSEGRSSCSCFVDNQLSIAFDPGGICPSLTQLNYGCGWNIQ